MRLIQIVITALIVMSAGSALAQGNVFPPLVEGDYLVNVHTAVVALDEEGVPLEVPTKSVGIIDPLNPFDVKYACVDAGPDELVPMAFTLPVDGNRIKLKAIAYEDSGCEGRASEESTGSVFIYFRGPAAPALSR
jgi:hypothetical protein